MSPSGRARDAAGDGAWRRGFHAGADPSDNLDATTRRRLLASLAWERAARTTLLITHDPSAARRFADGIVHMKAGRIVMDGPEARSPADLGAILACVECGGDEPWGSIRYPNPMSWRLAR